MYHFSFTKFNYEHFDKDDISTESLLQEEEPEKSITVSKTYSKTFTSYQTYLFASKNVMTFLQCLCLITLLPAYAEKAWLKG